MLRPGTLLQNRYHILHPLGRGGMGAVYIANDTRFDTKVAVKETLLGDNGECRAAFAREAKMLNQMRHPALSHVIDYFEQDLGQYLVMQFIEGESLADALKSRLQMQQGPYPTGLVMEWADQLLDALDYLHNQKPSVLHQDIKPENIILTPEGRVILVDFGLARIKISDDESYNSLVGYTPPYASPEQLEGKDIDPRSDLFSLAVTLYQLLVGELPLDAQRRLIRLFSEHKDPVRPANLINPLIPATVANVLHQALALEKHLRPQTAAEMRKNLGPAGQNTTVEMAERTEKTTVIAQDSKTDTATQIAGSPINYDVINNDNIYWQMIASAKAAAHIAGYWASKITLETDPDDIVKYLQISGMAAKAVRDFLDAADKAKQLDNKCKA